MIWRQPFSGVAGHHRQPDRQDEVGVRLLPGHAGVLVPGGHVAVPLLRGAVRQLAADVLDRAADDLRPDQGLDEIEQVVVEQELERRLPPQPVYVEVLVDLGALVVDQGQPLLERGAGVQVADLPLGEQLVRPPVDVRLVLLDDGVDVAVGEDAPQQQEAVVVEHRQLFFAQSHVSAPIGEGCFPKGAAWRPNYQESASILTVPFLSDSRLCHILRRHLRPAS